jgi:peroxiredoxin
MRNGRYETQFAGQFLESGHRIRIEADGYMPGISRLIHGDEQESVINFVLQKATGISGIVRRPDGSALAAADVVLVAPSQPASIRNGQLPYGNDHRTGKTDDKGHFGFPPLEPPFTILVLHYRGFAEKTVDTKPSSEPYHLQIQPWGRVEGTLKIGKNPASGQQVSLYYERQGNTPKTIPWWSGETKTDDKGNFLLERVIPGKVHVSRSVTIPRSAGFQSVYPVLSTSLAVAPSVTTHAELGGTGRPIIGKLIAPEISGAIDWTEGSCSLIVKPTPGGIFSAAFQKLTGALGDSSPVMAPESYVAIIERDGAFRINDVKSGNYALILTINEPSRDPSGRPSHQPLASARREVSVSEMPGGRSDEPLDLGTITLTPVKRLPVIDVGDLAPDFRVESVDGKAIELADYRGKFVLLEFWATWSPPCLDQIPYLKSTFDALGQNPRLAMIGLSLDVKKETPRAYAAKHSLGWTQGFLGEWSRATLPDAYGVRGIPSIWLIGPDGRVIAKDLNLSRIQAAVAEALGRP